MRLRPLTSSEMRKRGCEYCMDHAWIQVETSYKHFKRCHACTHDICPYRELDKYDTYEQYLKHSKHEGIDDLLGCVFYMQRDLYF